jgi:hypothetical protein
MSNQRKPPTTKPCAGLRRLALSMKKSETRPDGVLHVIPRGGARGHISLLLSSCIGPWTISFPGQREFQQFGLCSRAAVHGFGRGVDGESGGRQRAVVSETPIRIDARTRCALSRRGAFHRFGSERQANSGTEAKSCCAGRELPPSGTASALRLHLSLQRRLPWSSLGLSSPCRTYRVQDPLLLWGGQTRQTATRVVASLCLSGTIHPDNGVASCIPWYAPGLARQVPTAVRRPRWEADMEASRNFTERWVRLLLLAQGRTAAMSLAALQPIARYTTS